MLKRLRQFQLFINLKKYQFQTNKIEFLKFIIIIDDIAINSKRIKIIKVWPHSKFYYNI